MGDMTSGNVLQAAAGMMASLKAENAALKARVAELGGFMQIIQRRATLRPFSPVNDDARQLAHIAALTTAALKGKNDD